MSKALHLPVLMYHHVSTKPGLVTLSPNTFRAQMQWLAETDWKTVTAADMEAFYRGEELPRKSVMLTFDDGWLDNWLEVFPVLKEFNLRAHIFLATGLVSDGPVRLAGARPEYTHRECEERIEQGQTDEVMLRWSEIREMHFSGLVEFHSHTHYHRRWDLTTSLHNPLNFVKSDILLSRERMKEMLGSCSRHLCWPEGYYNYDYIRVASELGFDYLYTTERRMNNTLHGPQRIGRISTKERESTAWLKRRLFCYTTPFFSSLLALYRGPRINSD
ncbi:carbohydrate transporter [Salmonella enterica]|nr:carbohydrate transporter [Salmonella enterica]HDC1606279.1 polysaccharide deacetylase family protein [Salmonella enterica]